MEQLQQLYYNPKTGFIDLEKLYHIAKENKLGLSYKQVKEWYNNQPVNEIYKQHNIKPVYQSIKAVQDIPGTLQMDLMDVSKLRTHNKGTKYLLNIIDVYSRYLWCYPLKTKKPEEIAPYLEKILEYFHNRKDSMNIFMTMDNGNEFKGKVKALLDKYEVKVFLNDPHALNAKRIVGIVERVNGTLWNKLKRYLYSNSTLTYIDILDDLIHNYNNTKHSTTKMKPIDILMHGKQSQQEYNVPEQYDFKVGDKVRHLLKHKIFSKRSFQNNFSMTVYTIKEIDNNKYILNNDHAYFGYELIYANDQKQNDYDKKLHQTEVENKIIRTNERDFQMPSEDIDKQILNTKRERKRTNYYIHQS